MKASGSERKWRRIVAVAGLAGVCGAAFFGSAGTASAAIVNCSGKVTPANAGDPGALANYKIQCDTNIKGMSMLATPRGMTSFSPAPTITDASGAVTIDNGKIQCYGGVPGPGFGCGVADRRTDQASAGSLITGQIGLGKNPCDASEKNPVKVLFSVSSEPIITSLNVQTGQDTNTVGFHSTGPYRAKLRGYGEEACEDSDGGRAPLAQLAPLTPTDPINCSPSAKSQRPDDPGFDWFYEFSCDRIFRAFTFFTNKQLDLFGEELPVLNPTTRAETNETAGLDCAGIIPGRGFSCGSRDRTTTSSTSPRSISPNSIVSSKFGLNEKPCDFEGKLRAWLVVAYQVPDRPAASIRGHYSSPPLRFAIEPPSLKECPDDDEKGDDKNN